MAADEDILGKAYDARLMRRLIASLRPYRWATIGAIALAVGMSALGPLRPRLTQLAIDEHIVPGKIDGLWPLLLLLLGSLALQAIAQYLLNLLTQYIGQRAIFDIRRDLFARLQRLAPKFFDHNPVGRLVTRLTNDVEVLNEMFTSGIVMIFADVFVIVWIVAFMFSLSWDLALVTLSCLPLLVALTAIFRTKVRETYRDVRVQVARMNAFMNENVTGMSTVQMFNQEGRMYDRFKNINQAHTDANIRSIFYYAIFFPGVELISAVAMMLILWYGGSRVLGHAMTLGTLVAFFQYTEMFFRPVRDLSEKYNILQSAMASSERIYKVLDDETVIRQREPVVVMPALAGRVEFRDVSFAYTPGHPVINRVSFSVNPGQRVAIVGATGSGKTTLTNLLCRFYEYDEGSITVDGTEIRNLDLPSFRKQVALVMQDLFLFSGDIATNITLGDPTISQEAVRAAAKAVGADTFIERLPRGYEEPVGERGVSLSAGQRQLLAFARALVVNPHILILDEATSSVDTESELLIQEATERLLAGRTAIIIAHRLSTIQNADQILVMHHGDIRERGTHQELLALNGIYARLHRLQYRTMHAA